MSELEWESRRSFVARRMEEVSSTFRSFTVYREQTSTIAFNVLTLTLTSEVTNEDSRSSMLTRHGPSWHSVASNPSSFKSQVPLFSACCRPPDSISAPVVSIFLARTVGIEQKMSLRSALVVGFVVGTLVDVAHGGFVSELQQSRISFATSPCLKHGFGLEAARDATNKMRQHNQPLADETRRKLLSTVPALALLSTTARPNRANAIGPVKIGLTPTSYTALPCPKNRPIPGQKAMAGMRGLCVTVEANLDEAPPKELNKVGVYGFVTDGETGDSVLANNPDLSTDAGQFAMIESITTDDRKVRTVP
jgi:hypothetical protein